MISIIIPAYNEKLNIKITIMDIIEVLSKYPGNNNYEIIVIDDNSSDATYKEVMSLNNDVINCIRLSRNSGSHIAMRAGLEYAKGEVVVCIFADGQEDSSILPEREKDH